MALKVSKAEVWVAGMKDKAGTLAEKLGALSGAGADFDWVLARRAKPGQSVVFLTPLKGSKQVKAAKAAGFKKLNNIHSVRVEAPEKPGLAAKVTKKLGAAGVNLRGFSAAAFGKTCIMYLALDTAKAADAAMKALKK